jgi:DNA-binding transcriptional LysR family regulator
MLLKVLPVNLPRREWPVVAATLKNRTLNPVVQIFREQVRVTAKSLAG